MIKRYTEFIKESIKYFSTSEPGKPDKDDVYGINIHRSSNDRGVCVGPYSAGCQVFADGKDFQDFMDWNATIDEISWKDEEGTPEQAEEILVLFHTHMNG